MSDWKEVRLDELIKFQRGHDLTKSQIVEGKYPVAGSNGIIGHHSEFTTKAPGLTIGRSGNSIGVPHFYENDFWAHNTTLYSKELYNNDVKFIYYLLHTFNFKLLNTGSAVPSLNRNHIHSIVLKAPEPLEQKAIASVLSSLDDKIVLLHRQNKTLEAMAETLFREWFVERAEEDWEEASLYDAIDLVGGGTPKTSVEKYWNGEIKWLSGGDISSNHKSIILSSSKTITKIGLDNSSAKLLPKYSTIISARGTVGKYCILSEPMTFSQSNYGVKPRYENCFFFTYLLINHSVEELNSAAYGSVFDTITTNTFKGMEIILPSETVIKEFEKKVTPYFLKIDNNQTQIHTLENLRDTLLPKLMNGEIRIATNG